MKRQDIKPTLAVGCFVFNGRDQLLMIQRGKSPGRGLWTIPGGGVEYGETLAAACRREVMEETGIDIELGEMLTVFEPMFEDFHYVIIDYLAVPSATSSRIPVAGDDASDARWVAVDEFDQLSLTTDLLPVVEQAVALADATGLFDLSGAN
ncbi:MAG: NUDIX hydrolase [Gammaproteobacteria bacterium]